MAITQQQFDEFKKMQETYALDLSKQTLKIIPTLPTVSCYHLKN